MTNRSTKSPSAYFSKGLELAIISPLSESDMEVALTTFLEGALRQEATDSPEALTLALAPTPFNCGFVALMMHFSEQGWHSDNIAAVGLRIRHTIEAMSRLEWIATTMVTWSGRSVQVDPRFVIAAARARMEIVGDVVMLDERDFLDGFYREMARSGDIPRQMERRKTPRKSEVGELAVATQ